MTDSDSERYVCVRNDEDQYSIWWAERELPAGWEIVGEPGSRSECLDLVERTWTDMRPRSVRESTG